MYIDLPKQIYAKYIQNQKNTYIYTRMNMYIYTYCTYIYIYIYIQ